MKLPVLSARELQRILENFSFEFRRQHGSHMFFAHPDGRTTVIPNHLTKIIKRDLKITRKEFLKHCK